MHLTGYWISHKAIKMCFDKEDSLVDTPYSTDLVWQLIKEHFSITDRYSRAFLSYSMKA
jgi:hypothetical protein